MKTIMFLNIHNLWEKQEDTLRIPWRYPEDTLHIPSYTFFRPAWKIYHVIGKRQEVLQLESHEAKLQTCYLIKVSTRTKKFIEMSSLVILLEIISYSHGCVLFQSNELCHMKEISCINLHLAYFHLISLNFEQILRTAWNL